MAVGRQSRQGCAVKLITLAQARAHVRVDHTAEDDQIDAFIEAASAAIVNYLKSGADVFLNTLGLPEEIYDDSSPPQVVDYVVPPEVKAATKILVGELFKNREAKQDGEIGGQLGIPHGYGFLPRPVVMLLFPLRDPALA
jgi:hypothetical protein